ncbi:MAG: SMC family ATPase, partial [Candidatus Woesearchaeota archaeon]|nr:SMC family ATPase [Candidatus Woesearchaeota archaeon]
MLLKSLRLENIRSYTSQTIIFPKGRVLLAGDIGSGKSTILHSIEFALFGLGELDSAGLLRHGAELGSVELTFELNSQTILIHRQLKRNKNTISQDTRWIIRNNEKQTLMPTELKAHIIKLLGYPEEFLTKSKNPIYRYTVYTPQEDMKAILYAKPDERLSILRQLFSIEKYKRIRENAVIYSRYLREQARELQGSILDFEPKKRLLEQNKQELASVEKKSSEKHQMLDAAKRKSEEIKNYWSEAEKKFVAIQSQKQEHSRINAEIIYKKDFV